MTRARNFRLAVSLALALVTVGLGGLSVYRKVETFQPLGFEPVPRGGVMAVAEVDDPRTGLQRGDQILLVNGAETSSRDLVTERLRERPTSQLAVLRGDEIQDIRYQRPDLDVDIPYLIFSLIGAIYLTIGLYTLLRHSGGPSFLFFLWSLASAALYLLAPVPPVDVAYAAVHLGDKVALLLLPALTLHLFLVFPSAERSAWARRLIPFLYLPGAVMLALELDLGFTNGSWIFGRPTLERIQLLDRIELAHFAALALLAVALLAWRFRRGGEGWEQFRQIQWMVWGTAGGYLPFVVLYYLPYTFGWGMPEWLTSVATLPLAMVPVTFAYAILRYKLWDIEVIVRDTISWTVTLLLGIIGFSLVNLGISRGVAEEMALARSLLTFIAGLGIAGLLVPTRTTVSAALERFQYRGTFGKRRALAGFGRELLHERDLGRICGSLLERVEEGVSLEMANLYLYQGGGALAAFHPEPDLPSHLPLDVLGEETWTRDFHPLSGVALPGEPMSLATRLFLGGARYAFPLAIRGRQLGLLVTGFKQDQTPLNSEDTELIRHLLNQAALAIENAQLVGQLQLQLEEVQRLQRYTEGIFESSPAGIAVLDDECNLVSVNKAFATITGFERAELMGRDLESVLPVRPLPGCGEGPVDVSWCDAEGRERHLQLSLASFERGWRQGLRVLVVHDVSERVAMENALREKDRLAALGMLAAGVAHEVNTPITGISSYAQMLLEDTAPTDPHYEILKKVERQTFRAARIVNNLLEFARRRQNEPRPVAMAPLLTECADLLGDRMGKRQITLDWTPPEEPVQVVGCDGELQQVFTNLILNAIDAMNETGGRIAIGLETDGTLVRVRVQDSGPGIPPEKLEMVFQPFYSTKLNRGGTGLGLSISYDIVRRHGGDLRVVSPPGEGACFLVELPRYAPSATATV